MKKCIMFASRLKGFIYEATKIDFKIRGAKLFFDESQTASLLQPFKCPATQIERSHIVNSVWLFLLVLIGGVACLNQPLSTKTKLQSLWIVGTGSDSVFPNSERRTYFSQGLFVLFSFMLLLVLVAFVFFLLLLMSLFEPISRA